MGPGGAWQLSSMARIVEEADVVFGEFFEPVLYVFDRELIVGEQCLVDVEVACFGDFLKKGLYFLDVIFGGSF